MGGFWLFLKPLRPDSTKWSKTPTQTNCLNVFEHFVESDLKGLNNVKYMFIYAMYHSLLWIGISTKIFLQRPIKNWTSAIGSL